MTSSSTEPTELQHSSSSPSAFWRAPERVLAVIGAAGLRALGLLSEEWTAAVLLTALSAPITSAAQQALRRLKKKE